VFIEFDELPRPFAPAVPRAREIHNMLTSKRMNFISNGGETPACAPVGKNDSREWDERLFRPARPDVELRLNVPDRSSEARASSALRQCQIAAAGFASEKAFRH
jgi:hypothetical protein